MQLSQEDGKRVSRLFEYKLYVSKSSFNTLSEDRTPLTEKQQHYSYTHWYLRNIQMELAASLSTANGKIICPRCQAMSKRTRLQCGAPAEKANRLCRLHAARSTERLDSADNHSIGVNISAE